MNAVLTTGAKNLPAWSQKKNRIARDFSEMLKNFLYTRDYQFWQSPEKNPQKPQNDVFFVKLKETNSKCCCGNEEANSEYASKTFMPRVQKDDNSGKTEENELKILIWKPERQFGQHQQKNWNKIHKTSHIFGNFQKKCLKMTSRHEEGRFDNTTKFFMLGFEKNGLFFRRSKKNELKLLLCRR